MYLQNNKRYPTVTKDAILGFFGEYRFLSNFHILQNPILLDGLEFYSSEAAYMSSKTDDMSLKIKFAGLESPNEAKKLGRSVLLKDNWDSLKYDIMYEICKQKFKNNLDLKFRLLNTGEKYLEETNNWKDTYWGKCNGVGFNNLGNILMKIRDELK